MIKNIKWWFFKRKLFKINKKNGGDQDGDVVNYKGKKYYVVELTKEVRTLTTPYDELFVAVHRSNKSIKRFAEKAFPKIGRKS